MDIGVSLFVDESVIHICRLSSLPIGGAACIFAVSFLVFLHLGSLSVSSFFIGIPLQCLDQQQFCLLTLELLIGAFCITDFHPLKLTFQHLGFLRLLPSVTVKLFQPVLGTWSHFNLHVVKQSTEE